MCVPAHWLNETLQWSRSVVTVINSTCASPAATSQNVSCEERLESCHQKSQTEKRFLTSAVIELNVLCLLVKGGLALLCSSEHQTVQWGRWSVLSVCTPPCLEEDACPECCWVYCAARAVAAWEVQSYSGGSFSGCWSQQSFVGQVCFYETPGTCWVLLYRSNIWADLREASGNEILNVCFGCNF